MDSRIVQIVAFVLEISVEEVNEELSPHTIEAWDSLKHMNMVLALEDEFEIRFEDEEIIELANYRLIEEVVLKKIT